MKDLNDSALTVVQKWGAYSTIPKGPATATDYLTFADYVAKDTTDEARAICKARWEGLYATYLRANIVKQDAQFATAGLVKSWKTATGVGGGKVSLQPAESDVLLSQFVERLHRAFGVVPEAAYPAFADREAFATAYLAGDTTALGGIIHDMADDERPTMPKTCAEI